MAILRIPPRHKEDIRKIGVTNPLFRMFLEGLRGIYEIKYITSHPDTRNLTTTTLFSLPC